MVLTILFHFFAYTSILSLLVLIGLIVRDPKVRKYQISYALIGGYLSGLFWIIITYTNLMYLNDANLKLASVLGLFGNIFGVTAFIFFAVFLRALVRPNLDLVMIAFFVLLLGIILGIRYTAIGFAIDDTYDEYNKIRGDTTIFSVLALVYFLYCITIDYRRMMNKSLNSLQSLQIKTFYFALLISQLLGIIIVTLAAPEIFGIEFLAFGFITSTISNIAIAWAFIKDPRIVSLFNDQVYIILVANRTGTLRFHKNFYSSDEKQPILLSSASSAIVAVLNDLYDFSLEPVSVRFDNGFLQFGMYEHFFIITFTNNESMIIKNAIKNFSTDIATKFGSSIEQVMNTIKFLDLEEEFQKSFYFLQSISEANIPKGLKTVLEATA